MKNSYLETIKIFQGEVYNLSYHQQRYESVLKHFGISKFQTLKDYINPPESGLYRCRLLYTLNGEISVTYHQYKKRKIHSLKLLYDDSLDYSLKSTNRENINTLFEKRGDCDDILIVKNSFITDTSIANIALKNGDTWYTPKHPLLHGTTRQRYIESKKIVPKEIKFDTLHEYSHIALMNAMIDFDIIPIENTRNIIC